MPVPLYMDVPIDFAITTQLRRRGADVMTATEDGRAHLPDDQLLDWASSLGRILVTHDVRFLAMAGDWIRTGRPFVGLVYGHPLHVPIGRMIADLELIALVSEPGEWQNRVERLPL
jgi:hypothetical protein